MSDTETTKEEPRTTISVPEVSGPEAADATDRIEQLIDKYSIAPKDVDTLFNAMVAVYIRGRMTYGDRQPVMCSMVNHGEGQGQG